MINEFESWRSYWRFAESVQTRRRYVHSPRVKLFLDTVLATGHKKATNIPKGAILWRSQLGCDWRTVVQGDADEQIEIEVEVAYSPERMKPKKKAAKEGRVNPKGIPYLYLSNDRDTALAEARPWIGSLISIGRFETKKNLKLIDFSEDDCKGRMIWLGAKEPSPEKREQYVWRDINRAFSTPTTPSDDQAEYVPTQILAELFRSNKYDGIVFRSSCGKGHNVVLFNLDSARMLSGHVFKTKSLQFEFGETAEPYYLKNAG